jgi:hypothetical protein
LSWAAETRSKFGDTWLARCTQSTRGPGLRAMLLAHRAEMCFELLACERRALLDEADRLAARSTPAPIELHAPREPADPTRIDDSRRDRQSREPRTRPRAAVSDGR